jgi:hypothetical protein
MGAVDLVLGKGVEFGKRSDLYHGHGSRERHTGQPRIGEQCRRSAIGFGCSAWKHHCSRIDRELHAGYEELCEGDADAGC